MLELNDTVNEKSSVLSEQEGNNMTDVYTLHLKAIVTAVQKKLLEKKKGTLSQTNYPYIPFLRTVQTRVYNFSSYV